MLAHLPHSGEENHKLRRQDQFLEGSFIRVEKPVFLSLFLVTWIPKIHFFFLPSIPISLLLFSTYYLFHELTLKDKRSNCVPLGSTYTVVLATLWMGILRQTIFFFWGGMERKRNLFLDGSHPVKYFLFHSTPKHHFHLDLLYPFRISGRVPSWCFRSVNFHSVRSDLSSCGRPILSPLPLPSYFHQGSGYFYPRLWDWSYPILVEEFHSSYRVILIEIVRLAPLWTARLDL